MWWAGVFVKRDFNPMAWNAEGQHISLICLGLFVVVLNSFGQCNALTQTRASMSSIVLGPHFKGNINNGKAEQSTGAVRFGRLILGRNVKPRNESFATDERAVSKVISSNGSLDDEADYQSDMGWESKQLEGQVYGTASPNSPVVASLLQMEPRVECVGDSMKLTVHDTGATPGALFFVDRGNHQSPLPLSQLPSSCGHSMRTTRRDWIFIAIYNGCYVTREDDKYVLPLRWWGLPMKMSCPAKKPSKPNPPTVSCYPEGMVVKMEGGTSAEELRVKFKGHWQPLMSVSPQCGYSVVAHLEAVIISAHYEPCVETKDGMFTLELAREGEIKVSCPGSVEQPFPRPSYPQNPVTLPPVIALQQSPMFPPRPTPPPKPQAPLQPYYTKPAEKPKPATPPPWNPQYHFPFYPQPAEPVTSSPPKDPQPPWYSDSFYPQPAKPVTRSPPKEPQPPWYSESFYPQPAKPVTRSPPKEPQPHWYSESFYPQPAKPVTSSPPKDPQPPWYSDSFYPQPAKPVTRSPPKEPQPPWYSESFYPQPAKPVTRSPPKEPQPPWYSESFYPQPAKPVTRSPPKDPQPPWYSESFYPQPAKPVTRSPPKDPQPPWYSESFYPQPAKPVTRSPPKDPQPPWYSDSFYPQPAEPVTHTPATLPPATEAPNGKVYYPYYQYPYDPQPAKPATHPPASQKPTHVMLPLATEKPTTPLHPYDPHPYYQHFYPRPAKPITIPLRPGTQKPEQTPLAVHTWTPASPQSSHPRTTKAPESVAPSTRPGDPYPPHPGYCPTICPTGFLNCCPMPVSFHQHHHNHFGPVASKDGVIIPHYPFKYTSDLFNYVSVSGPTQATTTPEPVKVQTVAPSKTSLTGFHDYWSRHGMRFSTALASYGQAPSDANKPSEPQRPKQSHFQPYNPQPMHPYFQAPSSDSNKPTEQQRPMQPYLPYNPQRLMHAYPLPYNPQGPVQPNGQAPVYSNKPLELQRPASDPSKPSEPQALSSGPNKPLKPQPSTRPHYPFRPPPMWHDPDVFYASKPLMQPDHHQTQLSESAMHMHGKLEQLTSPQEQPHRPVKEWGGSLPSNSEGISSLQQPNPSSQQMPTHYGSLPIYYAGSKPSYPQKPEAKPSGKPSRPEFPESFEHYWKPIVPLGSNQGFHVSYPAQSAGGSYPAQSAGGEDNAAN
ncbi:proline-rich extensin-like protein EPR1 [Coregonus clupeaformis]|uniref:proline-rich extensin-like protein EPR1 n=1 Tax=Coregonus clupeaformis TaxID=59861 RepID=UPI001E1C7D49|nr:proline-rich extensin-like protein EPR1 [Coregonus clupeaformis]